MGQAPWPARDALVPLLLGMRVLRRKKRPTRGSAADVGVRPTICADVRKWEDYAALGCHPAPLNAGYSTLKSLIADSSLKVNSEILLQNQRHGAA